VTDLSDTVLHGRGHLDDEVISALIDDELPVAARDQADRHRSDCARCRQRAEELGRAAATVAGLGLPGSPLRREAGAVGRGSLADAAVAAVLGACAEDVRARAGDAWACAGDVGSRLGVDPEPVPGPRSGRRSGVGPGAGRRRARSSGVLVGVLAVAAAGLVVGGLHTGPSPAGPSRSMVLTSSLGSFPNATSLRSTLEATVASIDVTGPASATGATASLPCHREAARAAELAAATAVVPSASGMAGPEASFAAPVDLAAVPAEVFTFPRLSAAGADGAVTRLGTYAVVVEDGTCAVVARFGW
jgi:hypothetical protein